VRTDFSTGDAADAFDFALASILISGIVTTVLVAGVYWIDRRRHADEEPPAPVAEAALTGSG